ncbi:MAG: Class beta-lactamase-related serine hydrolase [Chloroflexi bacterium]|nr:Class beta-lactamase-related serine hydrolase [Chloroflexota bacterium]
MTARNAALRAADAVADRFLADKHIPGVAYGVVARGDLIHSRGIGTLRAGEDAPPDAESVFRIASMTKSFTAATLLSLRDEGRLALDDPIARHVPELEGLRGPTADSPPITVRHLLTMSSGLATDDPWGDRQQGLDLAAFSELLRGPLTFAWAPATRFEYSNLGYGILGRLITNVAGAEYREVVGERLLGPLGMHATTYLEAEVEPARLAHGYLWRDDAFVTEPRDPYGALASMGGVLSSVRDLSRWVAFLADAFPARDDPEPPGGLPLSRASRREMQQVHRSMPPDVSFPSPDADPTVIGTGYGMGLFVQDDLRWGRIVGHSGGYPGFGSNMRWHPASGLGVIVLANHRYAPSTKLARELMESLLAANVVPASRLRSAASLQAARRDIERLLVAWDDDLAASLFAMNVDLDETIAGRRASIERIWQDHGPLHPDPDLTEAADSPLHAIWWLLGEEGGRVRVEVRLSPESRPRVQTLDIREVPAPPPELTYIAVSIVAAVNGPDPAVPTDLATAPEVDRPALTRALRIVAERFAPLTLGPATAVEADVSATWRLRTAPRPEREMTELDLQITRDRDSRLVRDVAIVQRGLSRLRYAD